MRILLVTPRPPAPLRGGDRLRLHHLLRFLGARHQVTLFTLARTDEDVEAARTLSALADDVRLFRLGLAPRVGRSALGLASTRRPLQARYFWSREMARAIGELRGHDVALGSLIRTADYLLGGPIPVVVDIQDSLSMHYRQAIPHLGPLHRALYRIELPRLDRLEREVLRRAEAATLVSPVDLADVQRRAPGARLELVGNGVDARCFHPDPAMPPIPDRLLFLGNLRTLANRDMALYLARDVLPRVRSARPGAHLHIVGMECPRSVRELDDGHAVNVLGFVDDPVPHLRRAWATVCPMRFGAGVQNKVLESVAVGTPAVVTPQVAEALGLGHGEGVLITEGTGGLARRCAELLADPGLRREVSEVGLAVVAERFSWERALAPLDDLLREVAAV